MACRCSRPAHLHACAPLASVRHTLLHQRLIKRADAPHIQQHMAAAGKALQQQTAPLVGEQCGACLRRQAARMLMGC